MNRAIMVYVILMAAMLAAPRLGQAIDCGQVSSTVAPCLGYLQDGSGAPPQQCCEAIRKLVRITQSQQDRQSACECLKAAASTVDIKADVASDLPGKCGVSISVPIRPDINCQSIS